MIVNPKYPNLVELNCIPFMYHSAITGKFIEDRKCFAIRLDTNYYFDIMDLLGEYDEIYKWLDNNYKEKMSHAKINE